MRPKIPAIGREVFQNLLDISPKPEGSEKVGTCTLPILNIDAMAAGKETPRNMGHGIEVPLDC